MNFQRTCFSFSLPSISGCPSWFTSEGQITEQRLSLPSIRQGRLCCSAEYPQFGSQLCLHSSEPQRPALVVPCLGGLAAAAGCNSSFSPSFNTYLPSASRLPIVPEPCKDLLLCATGSQHLCCLYGFTPRCRAQHGVLLLLCTHCCVPTSMACLCFQLHTHIFHRIIALLRLEKTLKITESNHNPTILL